MIEESRCIAGLEMGSEALSFLLSASGYSYIARAGQKKRQSLSRQPASMATLTQPTQRRGKSVQYAGAGMLEDEDGSHAAARVDMADEQVNLLHQQHHQSGKIHHEPFSQLLDDDPRMRNKGDLYTLPSNAKVHCACCTSSTL